MKTYDDWVIEIETRIAELKLKGRNTYYNISAKMTKPIATKLENYFSKSYEVEFKRCLQCENKYDIIITWRNNE